MPVETSFYSANRMPDYLGAIDRGMRMGDMIKQRKFQQEDREYQAKERDYQQAQRDKKDKLNEALKQNIQADQDGNLSFTGPQSFAEIAEYGPEAIQYANQINNQRLQRDRYAQEKDDRAFERQYKKDTLQMQKDALFKKNNPDPLTPRQRLSKMGAEAQNKVGSMVSAVQALDKMKQAMAAGYNPQYVDSNTPFIGSMVSDNPFTENQRVLSEVVGRLQSGGAINADEGERFIAMGPRAGDDAKTRQRKLQNQYEFIQNKLSSFGLKQDELVDAGFDYDPNKDYGFEKNKGWNGPINKAYADDDMILKQQEKINGMDRAGLLKFLAK